MRTMTHPRLNGPPPPWPEPVPLFPLNSNRFSPKHRLRKPAFSFAGLVLALVSTMAMQATEDILVADFESADYGQWKTTGDAFGPGPAHGALPGQMPVDGFEGKGLVNSFYGGDASTGSLTSPGFKIERPFIRFLIGGGKQPEKACMNLLIDGKVVRTATGPNDKPGGTEALQSGSWDVSEFLGKTAVIQILDLAQGGWGHINVDQIVQSDRRPPQLLTNVGREFSIQNRYLNIPIRNGAPKRQVAVSVNGVVEVRNEIELADAQPDWWAPLDVSAWHGRMITLVVDRLSEDSSALKAIQPSDKLWGADDLYREPLRGQFHFSPRRGWNNDPNGLVFFKGEYHLFFQHNPYGWNWGNMHWGHAVSRDLVHWQELGDVLRPDSLGAMFSGSAVVDWDNTSGLGRAGDPAQVLIYTAAGDRSSQCLASSTDGRTYAKFSGNPVVPQITPGNRDPKVIWYQPTEKWVMTLYVETNHVNTIHFLSSSDLKNWSVMSQNEGFFECPDFFELPLDGKTTDKKWVLTAANSDYMVGSFDGRKFTPETGKLKGNYGRGFYAAQTFSDIPQSDGRRIQIGWFQTPTPAMPFNQSMTLPLNLQLTQTPTGPRLTWSPVKELSALRAGSHRFGHVSLQPGGRDPLEGIEAELVELRTEFEPGTATDVVIRVRGALLGYNFAKQELSVNDLRAPAPLKQGKQRLIVYCDRMGMEVFASDGLTYIPTPFIPEQNDLSLGIQAKGGVARVNSLQVYTLKSAWNTKATLTPK
jgi:fructan beta-fructosidase